MRVFENSCEFTYGLSTCSGDIIQFLRCSVASGVSLALFGSGVLRLGLDAEDMFADACDD